LYYVRQILLKSTFLCVTQSFSVQLSEKAIPQSISMKIEVT